MQKEFKSVDVWYAIVENETGPYPKWFLNESGAESAIDEYKYEEMPVGYVETYEGSNIHKEALKNESKN